MALALASGLFLAAAPGMAQEGTWTDVFNGKDLTGLKKHGNGNVTVDAANALIDVSGGNGYLYTEADYTHYRARVEWKNIDGGNAGYLHHIDLNKHSCGTWPSGPELQMYQGDVGSIWTTDCKFNTTGTGDNFSLTGPALNGYGQYGCNRKHFVRPENKEKVGQWNTWEIFVKGDSLEVKVNGSVVMRISKLMSGGDVPMVKGKMGLQIEGSHVQWRNWQVMDLSQTTRIAPMAAERKGLARWAGLRPSGASGIAFSRDGLPEGGAAKLYSASGKTLSISARP
jgi:hypothetical protein